MAQNRTSANDGVNRAKMYQLALFPLNNGATNVYFVLSKREKRWNLRIVFEKQSVTEIHSVLHQRQNTG